MKTKLLRLVHSGYAVVAVALATAGLLPVFTQTALAGQITSRSITMSDSGPSDTGVSYQVQFTPVTTGAGSMVIDFCQNDPIINDTCTTTNGINVSSVGFTAGTGTANWTLGTLSASTVKITQGTGSALGTSQINFTLTNITNPTAAAGTFYARIYTYSGTTYGTYSSATSVGNDVDYGGIALSTAQTIAVTAKVQEQLTFCVYTGGSCGTGSSVTLGNQGVLSSTSYWIDTHTQYDIQTNAQTGATVSVKSPTTLTGPGGATIAAQSTASPLTNGTTIKGTSTWGMCTYAGTANGGTSGTFAAAAKYNGVNGGSTSACSSANITAGSGSANLVGWYYGGVGSTYGDQIASQGAGSGYTGNVVPLIASTTTSQTAGVYTMNLMFIATGTF